jgi:putative inorganic carbon (HCO3(-)) transporter
MILFSLPLLVYWFFSSRGFLKRILAVALFLLNVTAIIVTYSRGGAIVLTVVLILLIIEHVRRVKPKYFGFITSLFLILIVAILIFIPVSYWQRQRSVTYTQTDPAVMERISYLPFAWRIFKEDPIIGSGPGTFKEKYATSPYSLQFRKETDLLSDYKRYAHNSYIEVLVGTGVLGIVVFFIILLLTFKNFNLAKRKFLINGRKEVASLVGAYRLSFISMLIYFLISSNNYSKYFWISLGLSQVALRLSQDISEERQNSTP